MERFFTDIINIKDDCAWISGDELKHLSKVLRMKPGDALEIFDGQGRGFHGELASVTARMAEVHGLSPIDQVRESPLKVCLVQGIPKGEKMEWVAQKATELGVHRIIPLECCRSVVKLTLDKKRKERQERWQKVAAEASRQCGRFTIPVVESPMPPKDFFALLKPNDLFLVPWEEGGLALRSVLGQYKAQNALHDTTQKISAAKTQQGKVGSAAGSTDLPGYLYVMIGPEGGLTVEEVEQAKAKGGIPVTLGPRILRTETAGLACLAILQYEWGDMGE